MNKKRYMEIISQLLNEHYKMIKIKGAAPPERQNYIDGFLTAARALDAFDYEELKQSIDKIHFEAFGKTIEERRKSELLESGLDENSLKIPAYVRKGELLK